MVTETHKRLMPNKEVATKKQRGKQASVKDTVVKAEKNTVAKDQKNANKPTYSRKDILKLSDAEIPPVIDRFRGTYSFLSNFSAYKVFYMGDTYYSAEAAYQGAKAATDLQRMKMVRVKRPDFARRIGRNMKPIRADWENVKLRVMYDIVKAKFLQNEKLQAKLLATRDRMLIEGNDWGDIFWGMVDGEGENNLGKILMRVREEIKTDLKGKFEQEN